MAAAIGLPDPATAQDRPAERADGIGWSRYVEPGSGTSVSYPAGIFSEEDGRPHEGEGRRFRTADNRAVLEVYGLRNTTRETPRSYLDRHLAVDKRILDYSRVTNRFFAISGINEGQVFYSRCNFARGQAPTIRCIYLYYPERETRSWDAIVTRISRSLDGASGRRQPPAEED
jgi:hypothetical protein